MGAGSITIPACSGCCSLCPDITKTISIVISGLNWEAQTLCVIDVAGIDSGRLSTGASLDSNNQTLTYSGTDTAWEFIYNETTGIDYITVIFTGGATDCSNFTLLDGDIVYKITCDGSTGLLTLQIYFSPLTDVVFLIFTGTGMIGGSMANQATTSGTLNYIAYGGTVTLSSP